MGAGRFIRIISLCAGAGIMAPSPVVAADQPAKPKNDPSVRICREQTPTGSRFTRRVCKSAEEWQRDEQYAQSRVDENDRSRRADDCCFTKPQ